MLCTRCGRGFSDSIELFDWTSSNERRGRLCVRCWEKAKEVR